MVTNTSLRVNVSSHQHARMMQAEHGVAQRSSEDQRWVLKFRRGVALKEKAEMVNVMVTSAIPAL